MKKLPTLFEQKFKGEEYLGITENWNPNIENLQEHLDNDWKNVVPTIKYDGTACMIFDGRIYRRWDNKKQRTPPKGAIFCDDHVEGHEIWWIPCREDNPSDKYYIRAYENAKQRVNYCDYSVPDGTYELVGGHFQNDPYELGEADILILHGNLRVMGLKMDYENVKAWCEREKNREGLVFWTVDENNNLVEPIAKIRRKDFGFEWNE